MLFDFLVSLRRSRKRAVQAAFDAAVLLAAFPMAMYLRLEHWAFLSFHSTWLAILPIVPAALALLGSLGVYRPMVRYISSKTFGRIVAGGFGAAIALLVYSQATGLFVPRSVPFIWMMLAVSGMILGRFAMRYLFASVNGPRRTPVLVWGGGDMGQELIASIQQGRKYRPVAIIDDDPSVIGEEVHGLRVHGPDRIESLLEEGGVDHVLVALDNAAGRQRQNIVDIFGSWDVEILTVPVVSDIVSGRASISQIRPMKIEDLLGRDPVAPDQALLSSKVQGRAVLVSGAGGSIGSELCRQILECEPRKLVMLEVSEYALYAIEIELGERLGSDTAIEIVPILGSVGDEEFVRRLMVLHGVETVFHAAAYKHVPLVEANVVAAIENNVLGTLSLARAAVAAGVSSFTLISTDKAVRPTNVMGASKRVAELVCRAMSQTTEGTLFSMVRFGNVLGSSGSVIPRFRAQIEAGGPLTVTHPDITRFFMTIPEAAQLVIQAAGLAKGGDTFLLDMGAPIRFVDLATRMVRLSGAQPFVGDAGPGSDLGLPREGDVEIRFTGLRPGEKLYEELLIDERAEETGHPRIMRANEAGMAHADLADLVDRLRAACIARDEAAIRQLLLAREIGYAPDAPSAGTAKGAPTGERKTAGNATADGHGRDREKTLAAE